jgi:hypothetical protein
MRETSLLMVLSSKVRWERRQRGREAQRRHPDLNRGMEVLQTSALPLGYAAGACRAGDRVRTGDPNLGKVVLYQLSYTRIVATREANC